MTAETVPCPACGLPTTGPLCGDCAPAAAFLVGSPEERLAALQQATVTDRPRVLLAAVRGGRLWAGVTWGELDLGDALLDWLLQHGPTEIFTRWIAEDAEYGGVAYGALAAHDRGLAMLRAPLWLAPGRRAARDGAEGLLNPLVEERGAGWSALAFRLGSCAPDAETGAAYAEVFPQPFRMLAKGTIGIARRRPTKTDWRPEEAAVRAAAGWRRWPLARIEAEGLLVCAVCGEGLPAEGACAWCGTDPDEEPPMALPPGELLAERAPCGTCGLDLTVRAMPVRCGGCGSPRTPAASG